jgi:hypothetical protein
VVSSAVRLGHLKRVSMRRTGMRMPCKSSPSRSAERITGNAGAVHDIDSSLTSDAHISTNDTGDFMNHLSAIAGIRSDFDVLALPDQSKAKLAGSSVIVCMLAHSREF